jgi:hypothetical protein
MALLQAEGRVTLVDGILATAVLVALTLKAVIGWWWADPLPGMCSSSAPPGRHVRSSPALTNAINKMANAAARRPACAPVPAEPPETERRIGPATSQVG